MKPRKSTLAAAAALRRVAEGKAAAAAQTPEAVTNSALAKATAENWSQTAGPRS